jgi:tetraprenyl-beta-curcumene synthase
LISSPPDEPDPTPLDPNQIWVLASVATRELLWGLRAVSKEIRHWRERALRIPDARIREDALYALAHKRTHADGAALFWTVPRQRSLHLLRLLVAYELIWDFLDNLSERAAAEGQTDGYHLHLAIAEAIDPGGPISDYYRNHSSCDDGGYLRSLVQACRDGCGFLPSFHRVRQLAIKEARRAQILSVNHDPDVTRRDMALEAWAAQECPDEHEIEWWELSGAASAPLTIHALLALAMEPICTTRDIAQVRSAYNPWLSAATTMLDSYVDQVEDRKNGNHSYIDHYPNPDSAACGVRRLVWRAAHEARSLRNGHKHAVIATSMTAMYLSKDSARAPEMQATTQNLINAGGSLARLLLPILRTWRFLYAQRSA